jgi:hypothetical protein
MHVTSMVVIEKAELKALLLLLLVLLLLLLAGAHIILHCIAHNLLSSH